MKVRTPISASRRCRGFTLLELLLVCALLVLATGLVGSFLAGSDQKEFAASLRELTARLKNSRRHAIIAGAERRVRLATEVEAPAPDDTAPAPAPAPDWLKPDLRLRYAATLEDPLEETTALVVTFFPLGSSTGGLIELSDGEEREAYIYVAPFTGKTIAAASLADIEDQLREEEEEP